MTNSQNFFVDVWFEFAENIEKCNVVVGSRVIGCWDKITNLYFFFFVFLFIQRQFWEFGGESCLVE